MKNQHFLKKGLLNTKSLCYNGIMLKAKTKVILSLTSLMLVISAFLPNVFFHNSFAEECTTSPCDTSFQVNVVESLTVSITTPQEWASGDIDTFLRNKISLTVNTNSASGFTAYMYSKDTTNLTNAVSSTSSPITLPTLGNTSTRGEFDTNHWGYSLRTNSYNGRTYGETDAGASGSSYYPMTTSNIQILDNTDGNSRDVYFGAKANMSQASGTYLGTVVFKVVTSTPPAPAPTPVPVNPDDDTPNDNTATYDNNNDRTVYTTVSSNGSGSNATTTTTTQITGGDNTSMYPLGETRRTESNISEGSQVATGLAIAASTAAAGGMLFFILAKRREDDEEDEEELQ